MGGAKKKGPMMAAMFLWSNKKRQALHMGQILTTPQIWSPFLAEEITSLVRGPDFDPYESRERWDPLAIHSGIWKMWWFWWDVSLKKKQNLNWRWTAGEIPGDGKWHM